MAFEVGETLWDFIEGGEIVWRKDLALNDREIDLDLVEPTSVNWCVNDPGVGPLLSKPLDAALPSVNGAIVDDPENASCTSVRLLVHDLAHQAVKGRNAGLWYAGAEDFGAVNIPGRDVGPGAFAVVLVFDAHGSSWRGGRARVFPSAGLDAGLLVGTDDEVVLRKWLAVPTAFVEIEDSARLFGESRVPREDPAAMRPRSNGILAQPTPQSRFPNGGHNPTPDDFAFDICCAEA